MSESNVCDGCGVYFDRTGPCTDCTRKQEEIRDNNRQNAIAAVLSFKDKHDAAKLRTKSLCEACNSTLIDEGEGVIFCDNPICPTNDYSGHFDPH